MKKPNFIIGKKQIVMASLLLLLGAAIYLNWQFSGVPIDSATQSVTENYGDAHLVNQDAEGYFANARLNQQKANQDATETIQTMLKDNKLTPEQKEAATNQALELAKCVQAQAQAESIIKAKGFEDCVVYMDTEKANVVVKSAELTAAQAAQIKGALLSVANIKADNITITEVK